MKEAKESHKDFDYYLKMIRKGNKAQKQEKTLANLNIIFNGRNNAINFLRLKKGLLKNKQNKTEQNLKY